MTSRMALRSRRLVSTDGIIDGHLILSGGEIAEVSPGPVPESFTGKIVECGEEMVLPGLIDLHIHGAGGHGVSGDKEDIHRLSRFLASRGTTAYMPTTTSLSLEELKKMVQAVAGAYKEQKEGAPGARIIGIHLEGPFLNPARKGAMIEKYLIDPSRDFFHELEEAAGELPLRLTLAPEKPGALELIEYAREKGYFVAGGHTAASYEEMKKGIDAGLTIANHLFNGMDPLHHRNPGVLGAYLTDDRVFAEVIADGIHIHPAVLDLAYRCKGKELMVLISDAILAAGLPPGDYDFSGKKITIDESGRSFLEDGTLAGSTCLMPEGLGNLVGKVGISLSNAAAIASRNPARVLGIGDLGDLRPGFRADLTILDENFAPAKTIIGGEIQKEAE